MSAELKDKVKRYESFLSQDPENPQLLITLGDLYHASGQFSLARACYVKADAAEPSNTIARARIASLLLSSGKTLEAFDIYQALISAGENDPILYHNLAVCLFAHSDFERARQTFESLVSVPSVARSAEYYLASIDDTEDRTELALERIERLLQSGDELYLRGYRAVLLFSLGNASEAVAEANRVLALDSENADAWSVLAMIHSEQLNHDEAERCLSKLVELAPGDARGWHGMGLIELQKKNMNKGIEYFERAVEVLPDSSMMLMSLAWAHFCNQDYQASENGFKQVLKVNPNFGEAWGGLACALVPQNKIDEAEKCSRKASALDKTGFATLFAKSLLLKVKGKDQIATNLLAGMFEQEVRPGSERYIDLIEKDLSSRNMSIQSLMKQSDKNKH